MAKDLFRVMVALSLSSAAGRKKLNGIHRFLGEDYDWDMELVRNEGDFTLDTLAKAERERFDGMLVGIIEPPELRTAHMAMSVPAVFIDHPDTALMDALPRCVFINDDHDAIVRLALRHLRSCPGTRTFGFVPGREHSKWSNARRNAFSAALRSDRKRAEIYGGPGDDRGALGEWLGGLEKPAAVLAAFDDRARDVAEACRRLSINVPDDVSVLGIGNDEPVCETTVPPLSSVAVDFEFEGYRAARELQAMMMRRATSKKRVLLFGAKDVVCRASTTASLVPDALAGRALEFISDHALEGISAADIVAAVRGTAMDGFAHGASMDPADSPPHRHGIAAVTDRIAEIYLNFAFIAATFPLNVDGGCP